MQYDLQMEERSIMKYISRKMLVLVMALAIAAASMIGGTYAWFTDSVSSGSNVIKSGNLDIEMYYSDELNGNYVNAENSADFFGNILWEPGYTMVKYIKLKNAGTLALDYTLDILVNGFPPDITIFDTSLANVLDLYYMKNPNQSISNRDLSSMEDKGTLSKFIWSGTGSAPIETGFASDSLLPGEEVIIALALHMQESAGNEYQKKTLGGSCRIQVRAEQKTHEADSFGNTYDAAREWDYVIDEVVLKYDGSRIPTVLKEGEAVPALASEDGYCALTISEGEEGYTYTISKEALMWLASEDEIPMSSTSSSDQYVSAGSNFERGKYYFICAIISADAGAHYKFDLEKIKFVDNAGNELIGEYYPWPGILDQFRVYKYIGQAQ